MLLNWHILLAQPVSVENVNSARYSASRIYSNLGKKNLSDFWWQTYEALTLVNYVGHLCQLICFLIVLLNNVGLFRLSWIQILECA